MSLTNPELISLLGALIAMLIASQALGGLFQRWHQPRVVGEILGGVALGPMVLGAIWPAAHAFLFAPGVGEQKVLAFVFWLGLVLLMFCSGLDAHDFNDRAEWKTVAWLSVTGVALPLAGGWWLASQLDLSGYYGPAATPLSFGLLLAMAITITAIPVISKIFIDLGLVGTSFARVVLSVAFIEDMALWVLLSVTLGLASGMGHDPGLLAGHIGLTLAFFAAMLWGGHRVLDALARVRFNLLEGAGEDTALALVLLGVVLLAMVLGVNPIFGAFLAGRLVAQSQVIGEAARRHIRAVAFGLFIPVFFASVGLKIDLRGGFDLGAFVGLLVIAVGVKTVAAIAGGRLAGKPFWPSLHLAVALNARGALGIVLATIALEARLISQDFYELLVLLALVTSQLAGAWLGWVKRRRPEQLALGPVVTSHHAPPITPGSPPLCGRGGR